VSFCRRGSVSEAAKGRGGLICHRDCTSDAAKGRGSCQMLIELSLLTSPPCQWRARKGAGGAPAPRLEGEQRGPAERDGGGGRQR
jgi:hypothetical protein